MYVGDNKYSSPERKVMLFKSLFCGRMDVHARRYESAKTGKCGYAPACSVEWTRGICDKKKFTCAVCPNRRFEAVAEHVIEAHLRGKDTSGRNFTMGVYPLQIDDTVRFAAIDFDKKSWRSDSNSVCTVLRELG